MAGRGQGQPLSHGAQRSWQSSRRQAGPRPHRGGSAPSPRTPGSWNLSTACRVLRTRGAGSRIGDKSQPSTAEPQLQVPPKAVTSKSKLPFRRHAPPPGPQTPQLALASCSQQMTCRCPAHLEASPPPTLTERGRKQKGRSRGKEYDRHGGAVGRAVPAKQSQGLRAEAAGTPDPAAFPGRNAFFTNPYLIYYFEAHWWDPAADEGAVLGIWGPVCLPADAPQLF